MIAHVSSHIMAVNPEVIIVCDYEEGYEILVEEFEQLIPNWPKSSDEIRCVDREDFFHLLQDLDKRGNVPRFVFALPRQSRIIIYHKEDPVNSYYDEINDAMAYIDEIEKRKPSFSSPSVLETLVARKRV